ncbi:nuclear 1 [Brachionus plicatilis]|uniref:Nuclear 1 n=1 Tax=Brachionus plicatilis TaxID=10195 RepID=A0A3M7PI34_BRAPC|nr:nuclear 1 [Brachionus plicatilis]
MSEVKADVLVLQPLVRQSSNKQVYNSDYLSQYDEYSLDNEKYFVGGQGGKQRTKKDIKQNFKHDPCGNVRLITSKLQKFEQNRRK